MIKLLHFSDAHIDIAAHGRHDPETGLPVRALDFLKALDTIITAAIDEQVDLVLFAGDAYKDRSPAPTYQREFGRRIMRLSKAGIRTLLLVGNHDLSPAAGRASALQEFMTLEPPLVRLADRPCFLGPEELFGLPLQVMALPWVSRSGMMAALEQNELAPGEIYSELETRLVDLVGRWMERKNPQLPTVLAAHCSVQGAVYGGERSVMLGGDLVLPGSVARDPRLDYVALGHIHKAQDINKGQYPPVIYPGSIERVDFGEAADDKFYVCVDLEQGKADVTWHKLDGRRFIDCAVRVENSENVTGQVLASLPPREALAGAVVRLVVRYPRLWDNLLDEAELRRYTEEAFEFHLVRRPEMETRLRLPGGQGIASLAPLDLLEKYWAVMNTAADEAGALQGLAGEIIGQDGTAGE